MHGLWEGITLPHALLGPAFSKSRNQHAAVFPCRDIGAVGSFPVYQPDLCKRKIYMAAVGAFSAVFPAAM